MIINFSEITKYFGSEQILKGSSGIVDENSRIGIFGANGAGKTTLLNILSQTLDYDDGTLYINPSVKIGYLRQNSLTDSNLTVLEEAQSVFKKEKEAIKRISEIDLNVPDAKYEYDKLLSFINSRDAYNCDVRINSILNGMGFDDSVRDQKVCDLSGGEKTRLSIAKLLLTDCNVLFLDEPTNHLDFITCTWLENYLSTFKGAVISVTHDRYYLDKVCDTIWEMEFGKITEYKGNYSFFKTEKRAKLDYLQKKYDEYIERQAKLKDYVARNLVRASTSAMAKSRRKELEKMEEVLPPSEYNKQIHIGFHFDKKSWFDVLKITDLSLSVEDKELFNGLSLDIKAGSKVAIVGENGTGKTTLFKALCGNHSDYSGRISWGKEVSISVFEQNHIYDNPDKTVINELWDHFPTMIEQDVRSRLAMLLFSGDDVYKKLSEISGGESARLQLAILSLYKNNTLLFDEPTNHLDMMSKEQLENALLDFGGTQFVISHDRYFLNTVPDIIVYLSKEKVIVFNGKFDEFQSKYNDLSEEKAKPQKKQSPPSNFTTKADRAAAAKKRNEISSIEKKIAQLEAEIKELEQIISDNPTDFKKIEQACIELEEKKMTVDELSEEWLMLTE